MPRRKTGDEYNEWAKDQPKPLTEEEREAQDTERKLLQIRRVALRRGRLVMRLEGELAEARTRTGLLLDVKGRIPTTKPITLPKRRGPKNPTVSVSCLSDLHIEEIVDPKTVNGQNEYTLDIARQRLTLYFQNAVKLYRKEAAYADIREHILWLGADFITGHSHDEFVEVTALAPQRAMLWCLAEFKKGIEFLRKEMDCPIRVVVSYGNHDRDSKKPRINKAADHSLASTVGILLALEFAKDKSIAFQVAEGYHEYVDVNGFIVRFSHGDAISGGGNEAGLVGRILRKIDAWNKIRHADLDVMGHLHHTMNFWNFIMNGSLIGLNQFGLFIGGMAEPPQQSFFLIDMERRQKTGFFPIHVTRP